MIERPPEELPRTVSIESKTLRLVENNVRLNLTIVDTPGFGDLGIYIIRLKIKNPFLVDNSNWYYYFYGIII